MVSEAELYKRLYDQRILHLQGCLVDYYVLYQIKASLFTRPVYVTVYINTHAKTHLV